MTRTGAELPLQCERQLDMKMGYVMDIKNSAIFTDPGSERAEYENLLLNLLSGLRPQDLSEKEVALCRKFGCDPLS